MVVVILCDKINSNKMIREWFFRQSRVPNVYEKPLTVYRIHLVGGQTE